MVRLVGFAVIVKPGIAGVTTMVTGAEVDPPKLLSPPYVAVTVFVPSGRTGVEKVATPCAFRVPDPSVTEPY
jgi:hypothetical protein